MPAHFRPAIDKGIETHKAEVEKILSNTASPTFANTIAAMEKSGALLTRVLRVFYNLTGSHTNPDIAGDRARYRADPVAARHAPSRSTRAFSLASTRSLRAANDRSSTPSSAVCSNARTRASCAPAPSLDPDAKTRMAEINSRLATLGTTFGQNVLADEQAYKLILDGEADLAGLPDFVRAAAKRAGDDLGLPGKHVITLARSSIETFLQFSTRRDLREAAFAAWIRRGEGGGDHDNRAVATEILALRAERAQLLGFETFAKFRLEDAMAKTPEAVGKLLSQVWTAARPKAGEERALLQRMVDSEGGNFQIEAWDWRHYAEKVRKAEYDLDEAEIKPYLQLDRMIDAAFDTATRLFGVTFAERTDLAEIPGGRAHLGSETRRRQPPRCFRRRLFRAPLEAFRRLDERFPRPAAAARRHPSRHRQRAQLRARRRWRTDAAELHRRPHAVPRVRPRAARAPVRRHLPLDRRHRRLDRLRRAALAALRALARRT